MALEEDNDHDTDPRIVPEAKTIPQISYAEAMELSYFGANVLHPRTIEPAMREHIPVRVKNTFDPKFPGTLVVSEKFQCKQVVKAVSLIKNVALIKHLRSEMAGTIGTVARSLPPLQGRSIYCYDQPGIFRVQFSSRGQRVACGICIKSPPCRVQP
jgi:aspartate kinase